MYPVSQKKPRLEEGDGHSRGTAAAATDGADISAVSGGSDVAVVAANRAVTGDEGEEENVGVGQEEHNTPPDPGNGCRDRGEIGALGVDHDDEGGSAPQTRAMVNQESDAADEDGQAFGGVVRSWVAHRASPRSRSGRVAMHCLSHSDTVGQQMEQMPTRKKVAAVLPVPPDYF